MKKPFPAILIVAAIFLMMSGKIGFFIPLIILYFVINNARGNKDNRDQRNAPRGTGYDPYQQNRRPQRENRRRREQQEPRRRRTAPPKPRQQPKARPKPNPYKNSGVVKYKDYDYNGAIEDFKKAIEINANDIPTHFNLACAYSLTEQKDLAYKHIDRAVNLGFKDLNKIKTHDAFAYIRIQDDFAAFEKNGFRLTSKMDIPQGEDVVDPLLLERLKKLAELRDRGILTEAEFLVQKEKLLG